MACRTARPKRELVRLVCTGEGVVRIDPRGKMPGRGAYLCPQVGCFQAGLKRSCLERALGQDINPESRAELDRYGQSLVEAKEPGE